MILLNLSSLKVADEVLQVQRLAYAIESEIIGFRVPYMDETIDEIMKVDEFFYGIYDQCLKGFIAVEKLEDGYQISRLCVHPDVFGNGYGKSLVRGVINEYIGNNFIVTTGALNKRAIGLYESCGFEVVDEFLIEETLNMVKLRLINK